MLTRVVDRRRFLQLAGGSAAATMLSDSIARALAIPANRSTGTLGDVEHIVVLMQENRSFDHYFGVTRGARGFGDPHPAVLPSGKLVWYQADGMTVVPPFRPDVSNLGLPSTPNLQAYDDQHYGVMKLTLGRGGYTWDFASALQSPTSPAGTPATYSDTGSGQCHGANEQHNLRHHA